MLRFRMRRAKRKATIRLAIAALGVVYGDIGTSPLYAIKECFSPESTHHVDPSPEPTCSGLLSLVFWSLTMVVTVKYLTFVMRADNEGAGGILALAPPRGSPAPEATASARAAPSPCCRSCSSGRRCSTATASSRPPISVLSAVEGLQEAATSPLKPVVVPLTLRDPGRAVHAAKARDREESVRSSARS